ncbi:MAG: hypothetical protein WBG01_16095, partial [Bacteroidota bacterium]
MRFATLLCISLSVFFFSCKEEITPPPTPPEEVDNPPVVQRFFATPNSGTEPITVTFTLRATDDNGLDSLVVDFGDASRQVIDSQQKKDTSLELSHQYNSPSVSARLTAYDTEGQSDTSQVQLSIVGNRLPTIQVIQLDGVEGSEGKIAVSELVTDTEGDPFTVEVSSEVPLETSIENDTLKYKLNDNDLNGTYFLTLTVTDHRDRVVEREIPAIFEARDEISGTVRDILKGKYIETVSPWLIMQGAFSGWVDVITGGDSIRVSVDANGQFTTPKLLPQEHWLKAFLTNGSDSSFVHTYTFSSGDRTVILDVNTNTGTDDVGGKGSLPLYVLNTLYEQAAMFGQAENNVLVDKLRGIDLRRNGRDYTFWINAKDTSARGITYGAFTQSEQNLLDSLITNGIYAFLPSESQPNIYKAQTSDNMPLSWIDLQGQQALSPRVGVVLIYRGGGTSGTVTSFDYDNDLHIDAGMITYERTDDPEG